MGNAGEHQEQGQFGEAGFAEGGAEAEGLGQLLEGIQETEDEAAGGFGREVVKVTAQGAAESLDARRVPVGEIGQGAGLDLAALAIALAQEDGGRGGAIGNSGHVHADIISHLQLKCNSYSNNYMPTIQRPKAAHLVAQQILTQKLQGEDPSELLQAERPANSPWIKSQCANFGDRRRNSVSRRPFKLGHLAEEVSLPVPEIPSADRSARLYPRAAMAKQTLDRC